MMTNHYEIIIDSLSKLIMANMKAAGIEQAHPSSDESEDIIAECLATAKQLRRLRSEVEVIASVVIPSSMKDG
jgi:hypothetical protein